MIGDKDLYSAIIVLLSSIVTCCGFTVPDIAPDHLSKAQPANGVAVTSTMVPPVNSVADPASRWRGKAGWEWRISA